jgi:hypothetical protein
MISLNSCHLICRRGRSNWLRTAKDAIEYGKLDMLEFALDQDPSLSTNRELSKLAHIQWQATSRANIFWKPSFEAKQEKNLACIKLLLQRGCDVPHANQLIMEDQRELLEYLLDHRDLDREGLLREALLHRAPKCLQALYTKGCLPKSGAVWAMLEPYARDVKLCRSLECLKVLVENSGQPPPGVLSTAEAASRGLDCLRFVRDFGAAWEAGTMRAASSVEVLRYALENGCRWGDAKLSDFQANKSLMDYAKMQGCPVERPSDVPFR